MRLPVWLALALLLAGVLLGSVAGTLVGSRQVVAMRLPSDGCLIESSYDLDHPWRTVEVLVCWDGEGALSVPEGTSSAQFR